MSDALCNVRAGVCTCRRTDYREGRFRFALAWYGLSVLSVWCCFSTYVVGTQLIRVTCGLDLRTDTNNGAPMGRLTCG